MRTLPAGTRLAYLDNLKVALIAGIIAAHAINSYTEFGSWAYQDVREISIAPSVETVFVTVVSFASLFLMGLFFLISGLLTPPAVARKGVRRFVHDRLLRLGVPFAAFTLLLWPLTIYVVRELFLPHGSYWSSFIHMDPFLDNGPMWFVGVLLIFSLGFAALVETRSRHLAVDHGEVEPLRGRTLIRFGAAIAAATFVVRLVFPVNSGQPLNLHLWEWPQSLGMFALGILGARNGWFSPLPERVRGRCGVVALIAASSIPTMVLTADRFGLDENDYFGGFGWPSLATSVAEGALAVAACVWILAFAQRRLGHQGPLRRAMARSSYAAFLLQGPVLIGFALALRPFHLSGEGKALILAVTAVVGSFALAWPVVSRTRLRHIL